MLKKMLCVLLLCFLTFTTSCSPQNNEILRNQDEPDFSESQTLHFVYQDNFYYVKNGILFYCNLMDLKELDSYSQCLCFDPLCEHKDSRCMAFTGAGEVGLCLRTIDGITSLYTKYNNLDTDPATYEIAQFDIKNAVKKVLVKGIINPIDRFVVTDDVVVFEENMGDHISLRTYSFADQKNYEQSNENRMYYRLIGCQGNTVYYSDDACNVFGNSFQYDCEQKLITGILPYGYDIHDGYLYFPNKLKSREINGMSYNSVNICRTPLNSPSTKNYEVVAFDVCCYGKVSAFIFGEKLYYLPCEPSYVGQVARSYDDMPDMIFQIINEHNGEMYEVELDTLSEELVVQDLGYNILDLLYASSEYVIFYTNASGYKTDIDYDQFGSVYVYERANGDTYQILYYGIKE